MTTMNEFYRERGNAFHTRYYKQLEGAKIVRFYGMTEDEFPTFEVELDNCQIVKIEVSRDPEGNGGGFLFGLNHPDMSDWDKRQGLLAQLLEEEANA
jgi:hypothetical protein